MWSKFLSVGRLTSVGMVVITAVVYIQYTNLKEARMISIYRKILRCIGEYFNAS